MGTDRIEEAQGPCPCGRGEIIVYRCTRDHPFATGAHWWQSNITCATCKDKYALEDDDPGKRPALVLRADILARERKREAWYERRQALMAAPDVAALLQQFVHRLHAEPSTVAKYRLLRKHGLIDSSQGTFTKAFAGSAIYANSLSPSDLPKVMSVLGHVDLTIINRMRALEEILLATKLPLTAIKTGISGLIA